MAFKFIGKRPPREKIQGAFLSILQSVSEHLFNKTSPCDLPHGRKTLLGKSVLLIKSRTKLHTGYTTFFWSNFSFFYLCANFNLCDILIARLFSAKALKTNKNFWLGEWMRHSNMLNFIYSWLCILDYFDNETPSIII